MKLNRNSLRMVAAALAGALLICAVAIKVDSQSQPQHEPSANMQPQPLVRLNVLVLDDSKRAVTDVRQDEFRIFENNVEQKISLFSKDDVPISYALVIDSSGSLETQFRQVLEAGRKFLRGSRPVDEGFVMRFVSSDKIEILQDFTSDTTDLLNALNDLRTEGGQTALIDAVYLATNKIAQRKQQAKEQLRHRALILITDGQDRNSYHKRDDLLKLLRGSDVQIFAIGLVQELEKDPGIFARTYSRKYATDLLNRLADETGGRVYYPRSPDEVLKAADEIMHDLRKQYIIGYRPSPTPKSKSHRKVKVSLVTSKDSDNRTVIARSGYTVADPGSPKKR